MNHTHSAEMYFPAQRNSLRAAAAVAILLNLSPGLMAQQAPVQVTAPATENAAPAALPVAVAAPVAANTAPETPAPLIPVTSAATAAAGRGQGFPLQPGVPTGSTVPGRPARQWGASRMNVVTGSGWGRLSWLRKMLNCSVTIDLQDATITQAAQALTKASGISIKVDPLVVNTDRITLNARYVTLAHVLEVICQQTDLMIAPGPGQPAPTALGQVVPKDTLRMHLTSLTAESLADNANTGEGTILPILENCKEVAAVIPVAADEIGVGAAPATPVGPTEPGVPEGRAFGGPEAGAAPAGGGLPGTTETTAAAGSTAPKQGAPAAGIVLRAWPTLEIDGKKTVDRGANAPWSSDWGVPPTVNTPGRQQQFGGSVPIGQIAPVAAGQVAVPGLSLTPIGNNMVVLAETGTSPEGAKGVWMAVFRLDGDQIKLLSAAFHLLTGNNTVATATAPGGIPGLRDLPIIGQLFQSTRLTPPAGTPDLAAGIAGPEPAAPGVGAVDGGELEAPTPPPVVLGDGAAGPPVTATPPATPPAAPGRAVPAVHGF